MEDILSWKLTEKYCLTIASAKNATQYKAQLVFLRKSCDTIQIVEHFYEKILRLGRVFSLPLPLASVEPRPALFRDGAFSCRHELPSALTGLAGCSSHHFAATTARPHGTCGMFRSSFRLLPTRTHAPRKRFAAAMRASPLPAGGSGGLCARLRRARGKAVRLAGSVPSLWARAAGKIPMPGATRAAQPGEPLAAGGTGGNSQPPQLYAHGGASVGYGAILCRLMVILSQM